MTTAEVQHAANRLGHSGDGYWNFSPRPDNAELEDQQSSFYEAENAGCTILLGGNGAGTSTLAIAKACRFLLQTPPPRKDCPFWFIAATYDQSTKVLWKEKIWLSGLIPEVMFDWERANWFKSKERLPYSMPLKPHANGNNWMLEFKGYESGAAAMMASAIGGFVFSEQFPWIVLEEVLRGCREYSFTGNKIVEFTPVKPELSLELEEMIENGNAPEDPADKDPDARYMPDDWEVFYANTYAALLAGHVDEVWFEQFFGMIPENMRAVRMRGQFASYEGVIYKAFNPMIHVVGDELWGKMAGATHYRGQDWGGGPHNAFATTWGFRNKWNQWCIYDERESTNQNYTTVDHLADVQARWEWPKTDSYGPMYADPADPDNIRIAQKLELYTVGRDDHDTIENMNVQRGYNSVREGIEHIQYLLKPSLKIPDPNAEAGYRMEPRLLIHKSCKRLIRCLRTYRWEDQAPIAGKLNPRAAKPQPLKFNDHLPDSLRYMLVTADRSMGLTIPQLQSSHTPSADHFPRHQTGSERFAHRSNRRQSRV